VNLSDLPPRMKAQAEAQLKDAREKDWPAFLEAAREMADAFEAPKRERDLLRLCCNDLSSQGIPYLHLSPKAREKAGWPDICFCKGGRFYGVELKTRKGIVSDAQKATIAQLAKCGAVTGVVRDFAEWRQLTGGAA
jgi:hypothetical protein